MSDHKYKTALNFNYLQLYSGEVKQRWSIGDNFHYYVNLTMPINSQFDYQFDIQLTEA